MAPKLKEIKEVSATLTFSEDFTESIQEMIKSGDLKTQKEIREYVIECLVEDVLCNDETSLSSHVKVNIEFETGEN